MSLRADKNAASVSAGSLDELISRNQIAARAECTDKLIKLPYALLEAINEDLLEIYENEVTANE